MSIESRFIPSDVKEIKIDNVRKILIIKLNKRVLKIKNNKLYIDSPKHRPMTYYNLDIYIKNNLIADTTNYLNYICTNYNLTEAVSELGEPLVIKFLKEIKVEEE